VEKLFVSFGKSMSRIGIRPITLPESVKVEINAGKINFSGPKGNLSVDLPSKINAAVDGKFLKVTRTGDDKVVRAFHGLGRSLAQNAVIGVSNGFTKELELVGTGYRVALQGGSLVLSLGFSHPITFAAVPGVTLTVEGNNKIKITGIDKQLVGQVAANIRKLKEPEPYKGKGIRYSDEVVRRKPGKAAAKGAA
jgi:large subunit ribosomal protein L6